MRTPVLPLPSTRRAEPACRTLQVESITRLFGGGVKTQEVDERCWLRPPAAKSALRSWWRAASAHGFDTLDALRQREGELFGSPATYDAAGRVRGGPGVLAVTAAARKAPPTAAYEEPPEEPLNVAYFAGAIERPHAKLMPAGARAELKLTLRPAAADEDAWPAVLGALRLWLVLGGAGARTRRGAGALALPTAQAATELGVPATAEELRAFLLACCRREDVPAGLGGLFCLARTRGIFLGRAYPTGEDAQRKLLSTLREARQDRDHPPGWDKAYGWGRSHWPEADAIRLHAPGAYRHSPDPASAGKFPRAALGLPIVVHFKDRPPAEPADHQVLAAVAALPGRQDSWDPLERYASPILLRPVRVWRNGRAEYLPVAVFTDCTLPASARPRLVAGNGNGRGGGPAPRNGRNDPKGRKGDVIASYPIQDHAAETLARVEGVFARSGFQRL